jgi:hypothetical protein
MRLGLNIRLITSRISSLEYTGGRVSSWSKSTMKRASTGGRAVLGGEHRVEVDLGDLREVGDELGDRLDDVARPVDVDAGRARGPRAGSRRADAVDHLVRDLVRDRREAERHVAQDLDEDAAEAERHDRAERRILDRADEHLGALREHLLDLDAGDLRVGLVGLRVADDRVEALADLVAGREADEHAVGLRLVEDVRARRSWPPPGSPSPRQGHRLVRGRGEPSPGTGMPYASATRLASGALRASRPSARTSSSTSLTVAWSRAVPVRSCVVVVEAINSLFSDLFVGQSVRAAAAQTAPASASCSTSSAWYSRSSSRISGCARRAAASAGSGPASPTA